MATISLTADPSPITVTSISIPTKGINLTSTYSISFTIINALLGTSTIVIVFPPELALTGTSICSTTFLSCMMNTTSAVIKTGAPVSAGSNLTVNVSNVRNSLTTTASSSFQISTYYNSTDELVDQIVSGLTVTADPVKMSSVSITPSSLVVLAQPVNYAFSITTANTNPANSVLAIVFPAEIPLVDTVIVGSSSAFCSLVQQLGQNVTVSCTQSSATLMITLGNIRNPSSTKPTSTFSVQTFVQGSLQEYLTAGLIVTMSTAMTLNQFTISASNSIVNQQANYTFTLTFSTTHNSNDKVVLTIPSEIAIGTGFQCSVVTGLAIVGCTQTKAMTIDVTMTFSTFPSDYKVAFMITGFTNNWVASPSTITVLTTTNDTTRYLVEQGSGQLSYTPASLIFSITQDQSIVLLANSTLKMTLQSPFTLSMATDLTKIYLLISLPSTSFSTYHNNCSVSTGSCVDASSSNSFNITGLQQFSNTLSVNMLAYTQYFTSGVSDSISAMLYYGTAKIA